MASIAQAPVSELERWRRDHKTASNIHLGENPVALPVTGGAIELKLEINTGTAEQLALVLTGGKGYQTLVGVTPAANEVFIDRTRSGPHFHDSFSGRHFTPVDLNSGKVSLRVLVDQSVIELYVNDGTTTITDRLFRIGGELNWSMVAQGSNATVRKLDGWTITRQ